MPARLRRGNGAVPGSSASAGLQGPSHRRQQRLVAWMWTREKFRSIRAVARFRTCGANSSESGPAIGTLGGSPQGVNATPHEKQARLTCTKEVSLKQRKYRPRQRPLTEAEVAELWTRRAAGESGTRIARHMGRYASSLRGHIREAGGIRPRPRKRARIALSLEQRRDSSRGLAAAGWLRSIE